MPETNNLNKVGGISFSQKSYKIHIHRSTILALNSPRYIRFLFNPTRKKFAVQACKEKVPESFKVPKYDPETWDFVVSSYSLVNMVAQCCQWEKDKTYRIHGSAVPDQELVEFDLNDAYIILEEL